MWEIIFLTFLFFATLCCLFATRMHGGGRETSMTDDFKERRKRRRRRRRDTSKKCGGKYVCQWIFHSAKNPDFFSLSPFIFFLHPFRNPLLAKKKTRWQKKCFLFFLFRRRRMSYAGIDRKMTRNECLSATPPPPPPPPYRHTRRELLYYRGCPVHARRKDSLHSSCCCVAKGAFQQLRQRKIKMKEYGKT